MPGFAYLFEMGAGKSKTVIDEAAEYLENGTIDLLVVLAGKGSYADWRDEHLPIHCPKEIEAHPYLWVGEGSAGEARRRLAWVARMREDAGNHTQMYVFIMNIEALGSSKKAQDYLLSVMQGRKSMVVVDESAAIRNWQSQRTKFLVRHVRPLAKIRRGLTGTPILKSPTDLWGLYMFLGPHLLHQNSFFGFRARYCVTVEMKMGTHKVVREVGTKNIEELARVLKESSYRVTKEQCLDLPPKIYTLRAVEMTDEQHEYYNSIMRSGLAMVGEDSSLATVKNTMSAMQKGHGVLCGFIRDDGGVVHRVPSRRTESFMELAEETSESTIVWFAYRQALADVALELRNNYGEEAVVEYHGGCSAAQLADAIVRFQEGRSRFFLSTLAKGFRGINLTRGTTVVYHSNTHDLEHRLQSEDRCHRIGQHHPVNYVDLFCRSTVEEKIIYALRKKIDIATAVQSDGPKAWLIPTRGAR
jgi:SNF2 family DNA or RNA helicase